MERRRLNALLGASGLLVIAVAAAMGVFLLRTGGDSSPAAFDVSTQPGETVRLYHFAVGHEDVMSGIPCYCGCGKSLGHHSLSDCFVRPDGEGYDSHASACVICLNEASDIERLMARGEGADTIRTWIEQEYARYGPPTTAP